ncbi:hypothetical protein PENTCL1PPCAC_4754, partial [Pristionchus entomophagus]
MFVVPSLLPLHDLISIVHHGVVDCLAIIANLILLVTIAVRSPERMGSYKILLVNTALVDLIAALTALICMPRPVPVGHLLAYIYIGPCTLIN